MRGRHLRTAITLLVLVGILAGGVLLGARFLLAPLPGDDPPSTASGCSPKAVKKGQRIAARQVQVSVYNAGTRAGLADETMGALTNRGFKKASVGNAPRGSRVKVAQIWTTKKKDAAARLVALQFGPAIKVELKKVDLGPGVDVVVGDDFRGLAPARRAVVVKNAQSVCLPTPRR